MTQAKVPVAIRRSDIQSVAAANEVVPSTVVVKPQIQARRSFRYATLVRTKLAHPSDLIALLNQPSETNPVPPSADSDVEEALAQLPLFKGVDAQTRAQLCARGRVLLFPEGEELMREGERVLALVCILRGSAKLYFTSNAGLQGVSQLVAAPAVLGAAEVANPEGVAQCSMRLLEKSDVLVLPADAVHKAMLTSPKLMENVLNETNARLREARELSRSLLFESAETRLARLLLRYLQLYGLPTHGGTMIRLELTQNDFAEALGLNRRSITRALTAWAKLGIVTKPSGQYVVRDVAKLEAIAVG